METKKYELTKETIEVNGKTLHRIKALKDFGYVKADDLGGFIENEDNLSQEGECWVYDDAKIYDDAKVSDYARIFGNALVYGNAKVYGFAIVSGNARVHDNAKVAGYATVYDKAQVFECSVVSNNAVVHGDAKVYSHAQVFGRAEIRGDAVVISSHDYIVFKNCWSSGRYFTWTRSNNMWSVGCFYGIGEELIAKAYKEDFAKGEFYKLYVEFVEKLREKETELNLNNLTLRC